MKHNILSLLALALLSLSLSAHAGAQVDPAKAKRSADVMTKIGQLDLLVQLLPLALDKEQLRMLLPVIEKARAKSYKIMDMEADDLAKLDQRVSKAVTDALEKGVYPPQDLQVDIAKLTRAFTIRRQLAGAENVEEVYAAIGKTLNEGQKKAMENSLDPKLLGVKETLDSVGKIKFFIREILLDPRSYDLLVKMSKAAG